MYEKEQSMKSYRTERQMRYAKQSIRNKLLFYSIIYNRKDQDYTLSRTPPNQRDQDTERQHEKKLENSKSFPSEGRTDKKTSL